MVAQRDSAWRITWISALAACVIAIAPAASAQDERAPWWSRLQVPNPQVQAVLLDRVQHSPASAFDPGLPQIPFESWLFDTLAWRAEAVRTRFVEWSVGFCGYYAEGENPSIVTATGPELCATGEVQFSAEKSIHIAVNVANAVRDELTWRPIVPSLRQVYIERTNGPSRIDSLDVQKISDLPDMLQLPFDQWPQIDFDTAITWDPPKPLPGQSVRFSVLVRNTGKRLADPAWIGLHIAPCCDKHLEVHRDWFPKIAPGGSARVDWEFSLPEGGEMVIVTVRPGPSAKMVPYREKDAPVVMVPPRK